ncbi:hypothetical protein [Stakelama marina]|nr:hypothetical protein [Stakelama marina]
MARLTGRGRKAGARAVDRKAREIAAAVREAAPGVRVAREGDDVVLSGRGVWRRRLGDPALRWIGGMLR